MPQRWQNRRTRGDTRRGSDLRNDDAGFFALEFGGLGKLAAQEFDESPRALASIGAQQTHPVEKNQQIEYFRVLERSGGSSFGLLFLDVAEKRGQRAIELARQGRVGRLLVDDAGGQSLVGLRDGLQRGKNIGVGRCRLRGTKLGDRKCQGGHELLVRVNNIL